jgi:squalene-hopene/tetraprenyl-beta-curcumene cyclase
VRRGIEWLRGAQNADGGWGEPVASPGAGSGESSPTQTGWALLGLLAVERTASSAAERGIDYLVRSQAPDGSWPERLWPGAVAPSTPVRYHLDRQVFPLMALGRYRAQLAQQRSEA